MQAETPSANQIALSPSFQWSFRWSGQWSGFVVWLPLTCAVVTKWGTVSAPALLSKDVEKQSNCLPFFCELVPFQLAAFADPPPAPYEADMAEEVRCDFHRVVTRHVAVRVMAFAIDLVGLCDHAAMIAPWLGEVQREFGIDCAKPIQDPDGLQGSASAAFFC